MKSELIRIATLDPIGTARRVDSLERQRDKLLSALRVMRERHQIDEPHHADLCEFCKLADAAIAEVEAGK